MMPEQEQPKTKPDYLTDGVTFPFHRAFLALCAGYAIKRARWLGYWIIDPDDSDNVLMKCKDGTVVSMKNGCQGIFTLANTTSDDWIVLKEGEKEELDLVQSSKCLILGHAAQQEKEQVKKTPADFGLPLPPRGWTLRFSERIPNLFQLVCDKEKSQPFSVTEANVWADLYGFSYSGRLSSDPLTYGFSRDLPPTATSPVTSEQPASPTADDADSVTPDNPFDDSDVTPPSDEPIASSPDVVNPSKEPHDFPDPDPTGLPDGTRVTRNGNRVTVHLSENFPRNLQRTQEISAWAARFNLVLIDDKAMLGRLVYVFTDEEQ